MSKRNFNQNYAAVTKEEPNYYKNFVCFGIK